MPNLFADEVAVGYAHVAVERAVDRYPDGLTYGIPAALADLSVGERVIVPLGKGNTKTVGYVVDVSATLQPVDAGHEIKLIAKRDDSAGGARLPADLISLARWISNYYCAPIGMTLSNMLPAAVKKNIGSVTRLMLDLGDPLPLEAKLPAKQKAVLETLAKLPADERPVELHDLMKRAGLATAGPIRKLVARKLLDQTRQTRIHAAWADHSRDARAPSQLTGEQAKVVADIARVIDKGFSTHLLFGVTGSGKTEVYIRLIEDVVARGRVAVLLVPEISLTPQTGGRLIGRFPNHRVAILHSGLTPAQRNQQWAMVHEGKADIVLGARSAVFAPVPEGRLGLVIVDEEHDGSYKQDQVPRYHGRDVAIRRAQLAECPIVLGSATPSLESWFNATHRQSFVLHTLTQRAPGLRLPTVRIVDFRQQMKQHHDRRVHLLGTLMEEAIARTLDDGGQILILLNRRGYANYIACPSSRCGWVMTCDHCDVTMVYHLNRKLPTGGYVECHHCLSQQKLPLLCPDCGSKISTFGLGTQRVEEELTLRFPQLIENENLLRIDSDSMSGSRSFHEALGRFGKGEVQVLVGTQMIAKGLDFPGVRLVGVINADTTINLPDFRATERTFQLVNQVAGRCGRGAEPGLTIVQTFNPNAPAIRLAADHDFESFAKIEIAERMRNNLPPMTRMARIVVRDEDHLKSQARAKELYEKLAAVSSQLSAQPNRASESRKLTAESLPAIRLRGPAPCPISRIADKWRHQIEVLAPSAAALQQFLASARSAGMIWSDTEMAIDVDPIALL